MKIKRLIKNFIIENNEIQYSSLLTGIQKITKKFLWDCLKYYYKFRAKEKEIRDRLCLKYFKNLNKYNQDSEIAEIIEYFQHNQFTHFPYDFTKKYHAEDVVVYEDETCAMKYVLHENKRMYFPKTMKEDEIKRYYNSILIEQDPDSPHCYETALFHVQQGDVIADIGAAEGNFSLKNVEKAGKMYLFECEKPWIEALNKTFEPWKEKVSIVHKYVSDTTSGEFTTLDDFLCEDEINFIKADIEGAEVAFLKGAEKTLHNSRNLQIAICTYHRKNDAAELNQILLQNGLKTEYSKRYMLYTFYCNSTKSCLRRCLIRAKK